MLRPGTRVRLNAEGRSDAVFSKQKQVCAWIVAGWTAVSIDGQLDRALAVSTNSASVANNHWAWRPLKVVTPPAGPGSNPIDAFLRSKLDELGIQPAPAASKPELLRRITFDLTGLPPSPAELRAFLLDDSPRAWGRVVDRLLASQGFGERWAQHWLDLAHYADSNGFELDADRPDAWRYRDWVIRAFNEDMPYDRFLTLQIAGDEGSPGDREALIASGFARSGPREVVAGNIDPEVRRQNELTEAVNSVGSVFLGLTIGCARCHDHKFDPLPTTDYYRLEACFAGARLTETPIHRAEEKDRFDEEAARIRALIRPLAEAQEALEKPYRKRLAEKKEAALTPREREIRAKSKELRTADEERLAEGIGVALKVTWEEVAEAVAENAVDHEARESLKRQIYELERQLPRPLPHAMSMTEDGSAIPETRVLRRGNIKDKSAVVAPGPPGVLAAVMGADGGFQLPRDAADGTRSRRRLALARWLTATNNPLTARVIVNRLWQHHFGVGLVATPSDFGVRGDQPSHLELLDWLAEELMRNGWRLKSIHRLMVTSQAYRASSGRRGTPGAGHDPSNRLLWRMNRRRMDAEGLRDSMLAVAGLLNPRGGGPGIRIPLEPEVRSLIFTESEVVDLWPVDLDPAQCARRSIYLYRKRNVRYPLFDAFDAPDALTACPVRAVSIHAPQALALINGGFAQGVARAFGGALMKVAGGDRERVAEAFLRCYARLPTAEETREAREFVGRGPAPAEDRWADFALALINSNEFVYVP